jgi:hypothetical protein
VQRRQIRGDSHHVAANGVTAAGELILSARDIEANGLRETIHPDATGGTATPALATARCVQDTRAVHDWGNQPDAASAAATTI